MMARLKRNPSLVLYLPSLDVKDCTCQAGLTCILTKKFIVQGTVTDVKQCMPNSIDVHVETVNMDKNQNSAVARMKRFLPLAVRIS